MKFTKKLVLSTLAFIISTSSFCAEIKLRYSPKTKKYETVLLVEKEKVLDIQLEGKDPVPSQEFSGLSLETVGPNLEISEDSKIETILLDNGTVINVKRVIGGGDGGSGGGGG